MLLNLWFKFLTTLFALCPGIGGSGRQSATRLATFMADYDLFQIEITRNYTKSEWREDVKKVSVSTCQGCLVFPFVNFTFAIFISSKVLAF